MCAGPLAGTDLLGRVVKRFMGNNTKWIITCWKVTYGPALCTGIRDALPLPCWASGLFGTMSSSPINLSTREKNIYNFVLNLRVLSSLIFLEPDPLSQKMTLILKKYK
jgi:hypothetical protein